MLILILLLVENTVIFSVQIRNKLIIRLTLLFKANDKPSYGFPVRFYTGGHGVECVRGFYLGGAASAIGTKAVLYLDGYTPKACSY